MNLRACLDQCSLALLRQIALSHDVPLPDPPVRGEVIRLLLDRLDSPGYLAAALDRLGPEERYAAELVAAEGGQLPGFIAERRIRQRLPPDAEEGVARRVLSRLAELGLVYRIFQATGPERGELYRLPDELVPLLPGGQPRPGAAPGRAGEPVERAACWPAFTLFALASFLRRWRQRRGQGAATEGQLAALSAETAELARELPGRSQRERWTLLAHLGLAMGLFRREEAGLEPTEALHQWLRLGPDADRRLWRAYVGAERWNDLERAVSRGERFAGRTAEPREARAELIRLLGTLPAEGWMLADEVERHIRDRSPDFLRQGFEVATARLVDLASGEVLGGPGSWERVEGPLVRYVLSGPLYWLGVLEWGRGPETWDRLRVTARGAAWLADSEDALIAEPDPLEVAEERVLLATPGVDLALLWDLEPYLELESRGPPSRYLLSRGGFSRGVEGGGSASELRQLLDRGLHGALPPAISLAIARWSARAGRFKLRPAVLLQAEEEAELDELLTRIAPGSLVRERLGPRAAAIPPARAADLAHELERMGHIPDVDASLRLMAGRRAYAALVDQESLTALLWAIRFVQVLDPSITLGIADPDRLARRLEQALGSVAGPRISRRARAAARRLRGPAGPGAADGSGIADLLP